MGVFVMLSRQGKVDDSNDLFCKNNMIGISIRSKVP